MSDFVDLCCEWGLLFDDIRIEDCWIVGFWKDWGNFVFDFEIISVLREVGWGVIDEI